jgi:hypothetical protein
MGDDAVAALGNSQRRFATFSTAPRTPVATPQKMRNAIRPAPSSGSIERKLAVIPCAAFRIASTPELVFVVEQRARTTPTRSALKGM